MKNKRQDEIDLYRELIDQPEQSYDIGSIEIEPLNRLICECHVVSFDELATFVAERKCVDLSQISRELKVGTGCHSCLRNCGAWIKELEKFI